MKNKEAYSDILELIGNTPLIKLNKIANNFKGTYFTKFEAFNQWSFKQGQNSFIYS